MKKARINIQLESGTGIYGFRDNNRPASAYIMKMMLCSEHLAVLEIWIADRRKWIGN